MATRAIVVVHKRESTPRSMESERALGPSGHALQTSHIPSPFRLFAAQHLILVKLRTISHEHAHLDHVLPIFHRQHSPPHHCRSPTPPSLGTHMSPAVIVIISPRPHTPLFRPLTALACAKGAAWELRATPPASATKTPSTITCPATPSCRHTPCAPVRRY